MAHFDKAGCEPEQFLFFLGCDGSLPSTMMGDVHVVHVESIIDSVLIARLEDLYTPAEFCWVLKPFVFRWLLDQFDAVFYFDSDGWITGSFDEFVVELGDSPILLTPHYLEPFGCVSECGVRALSLLRGGVFNAGFLAVNRSDQAFHFLHWWADHVCRHGRNDPDNGMCGDQRWLDLVPALFPVTKVSRHPGINVGYWNIHERVVTQIDGTYFVNGERLLFLHLSGFDKNNPLAFSSHLPQFTAGGALAGLLREYAERLDAAQLGLVGFHPVYTYRRWWHHFVKPYRWLLDLFKNPRSCR
ncbi:hypothetical protein [Acidithiobacillus thiooxidans]|uniref:hypothetical protein n=1 Tax=Acidithiobacillus thiooxidans TaxID=930 RepID=UPI00114E24DD|nr:hypothetical protein [Acidithiobacillus thiooxidans]